MPPACNMLANVWGATTYSLVYLCMNLIIHLFKQLALVLMFLWIYTYNLFFFSCSSCHESYLLFIDLSLRKNNIIFNLSINENNNLSLMECNAIFLISPLCRMILFLSLCLRENNIYSFFISLSPTENISLYISLWWGIISLSFLSRIRRIILSSFFFFYLALLWRIIH